MEEFHLNNTGHIAVIDAYDEIFQRNKSSDDNLNSEKFIPYKFKQESRRERLKAREALREYNAQLEIERNLNPNYNHSKTRSEKFHMEAEILRLIEGNTHSCSVFYEELRGSTQSRDGDIFVYTLVAGLPFFLESNKGFCLTLVLS